MQQDRDTDVASFGQSIERRLVSELNAVPIDKFANLLDLYSDLDAYAKGYFEHWLNTVRDAQQLLPDEAAMRSARRKQVMQMIIDYDPDRDMVVQVYGEQVTSDIEAASMFE